MTALAEAIAETVVPYFLAILESVSPDLTTYVCDAVAELVVFDDAAVFDVVVDEAVVVFPGIVSFWPIEMRLTLVTALAEAIAETVVPYFLAIPERVSPDFTTYVMAVVLLATSCAVGTGIDRC